MGFLGQFAAAFRDQFRDPSFALGFFQGALLALVVGYISNRFLFWWNRVLAATRLPAAQTGPSSMDNLLGCAGAFAAVLLVTIVAGYLLFGR